MAAKTAVIERAAIRYPRLHLWILEPSQVHFEPRKVLLVLAIFQRDLARAGKSSDKFGVGNDFVVESNK